MLSRQLADDGVHEVYHKLGGLLSCLVVRVEITASCKRNNSSILVLTYNTM